ncbi:ABC transporter ATP-binding protein [Candidatus Finniella inopinata]|uniref:ABC transporter ATP-binding protein n=1 Tax=Candidatus Finniella inopinata TaxID=1696036 RepID=A0A4Q7DIN9_9PROT|nr:ABC transporter ATP-binding protein [Candidatus Finniella inopinata]RZI46220.1 ABC transporter ATP-binding protein [Candidatus Finniella inopinata]
MTSNSLIRVENLKKSFGSKVVLDGIDLDISPGESFVVIGGSGSGKSVLIKCILGLLSPDSGKIYLKGQDISRLSASQRQELLTHIGMLFQGGALFDSMTVAENVAFGLVQGGGMKKSQARKIALEKLEAVDLSPDVADIFPAELSGGMQKRVALARAIATNPDVIFFDEPTTGLDPIVSSTINDLIVRCVRKLGASAVTITHDMNSLRKIADRVGLLFQGKLVWTGTVAEMDATDNPYVNQFIHGLPHGPFTDG